MPAVRQNLYYRSNGKFVASPSDRDSESRGDYGAIKVNDWFPIQMTGLGRLRLGARTRPITSIPAKEPIIAPATVTNLGVVLQQNQHISHLRQVPAQIRQEATRILPRSRRTARAQSSKE